MQPRKRATASQQAKHLPLRTDPPRPRATLSAKAIASCTLPPELLVAFNQSTLPTTTHFHLSLSLSFHRILHTHITHSNHVVKPNARDHGDAPRVHQGRHSIHQPLHVCCILLFLASCCPFSYSAGLLCLRYKC
jgi:hypothetical protein